MVFKKNHLAPHLDEDDNQDLPLEDNRDLSEGVNDVESTNAISTHRTRGANIGVVVNVSDPNSKLHRDAMTSVFYFKKLQNTPKGQEKEAENKAYLQALADRMAASNASSSSSYQPDAPCRFH
jgi:hypothetical protein